MSDPRVLYHMVRADFLERVRRYSFLLTLGVSVYLGYAVFAGQIGVQVQNYRGIRNSAWLGAVIGLIASVFLTLVGFYIVKNSIQRDRETHVGQILAATPISKFFYTLSKTLSNFAVLTVMVAVLGLASVVIQAFYRAGAPIRLPALFAPILIIGLSALAVTAALAVLFETIPGLRGGIGNLVYFFVWLILLVMGMIVVGSRPSASGPARTMADYTGVISVLSQMQAQVDRLDPTASGGIFFGGMGHAAATKTFVWSGLHWTTALIFSRLAWVAIAVALALLASVFFDRFDPARFGAHPRLAGPVETGEPRANLPPRPSTVRLTPAPRGRARTRFLALVVAEVRLMLRGHRWWWYAGAAALFLACLFAPLGSARSGLIAIAWLWPVLLWSQMGSREARFSTRSLVFSAERAFPRQLLAVWIAGVLIAVMTGGGLALHFIFMRNGAGLAAWSTAALFIPTLALAFGVCTESPKMFEALYIVWWYVGPLQHVPQLDFMGTTPASSTPVLYFAASIVLLAVAFSWRGFRLAHHI